MRWKTIGTCIATIMLFTISEVGQVSTFLKHITKKMVMNIALQSCASITIQMNIG